jgi:hypothetical protein
LVPTSLPLSYRFCEKNSSAFKRVFLVLEEYDETKGALKMKWFLFFLLFLWILPIHVSEGANKRITKNSFNKALILYKDKNIVKPLIENVVYLAHSAPRLV